MKKDIKISFESLEEELPLGFFSLQNPKLN